MPPVTAVLAAGRLLKLVIDWMGRALKGQRMMLWVRVFIIGLVLESIAAAIVAYFVISYVLKRADASDATLKGISKNIEDLAGRRDKQIAAMTATDDRLTEVAGRTTRMLERAIARIDVHEVKLAHDEGQIETLLRREFSRSYGAPTPPVPETFRREKP